MAKKGYPSVSAARRKHIPRTAVYLIAAALITLILEASVFNLSFWKSKASPPVQPAAETFSLVQLRADNRFGTGLSYASAENTLTITDPSHAYIDIPVKGRITQVFFDTSGAHLDYANLPAHNLGTIHTRIDSCTGSGSTCISGKAVQFSPSVTRTAYVPLPSQVSTLTAQGHSPGTKLRVWFSDSAGSHLALHAITTNPDTPFSFNLLRVAILFALLCFLILLRPRSELYRITLEPGSARFRIFFFVCIIAPCIMITVLSGIFLGWTQDSGVYLQYPGSYTYDFSQYQLSAQAILKGQPWLDLPVDPQLLTAHHPQSVAERNALLANGTTIYWDYVFYNNHWYSYFGIVPALVAFLPFQAVTSLFHTGGLWLNTIVASFGFLCLAVIFGLLALVRFLKRYFPNISVGQTLIVTLMMVAGSTIISLFTNLTFYCIPTASATFFAALGFWLWLGARRTYDPGIKRYRPWTRADAGNAAESRISYPRIIFGTLSIALTAGCRPPFILSAVLLIPLYLELLQTQRGTAAQPAAAAAGTAAHASGASRRNITRQQIRLTAAALVSAVAGLLPVLLNNQIKFGSILDFGSKYQMTVDDLTAYKPSAQSVVQGFAAYFWSPLQPTASRGFPFFNSYKPRLIPWMYSDNIIAGIFIFAPLCWLVVCIISPSVLRALRRSRTLLLTVLCIALSFAMCLMETYMGGVDWRYMNDFSWILTLASIPIFVILSTWCLQAMDRAGTETAASGSSGKSGRSNSPESLAVRRIIRSAAHSPAAAAVLMWILILTAFFELIFFVLTIFDPSRSHAIITMAPAAYHLFASVFMI